MQISGIEPSSVILGIVKDWDDMPTNAKTNWSQKEWCNKPTKLQFQTNKIAVSIYFKHGKFFCSLNATNQIYLSIYLVILHHPLSSIMCSVRVCVVVKRFQELGWVLLKKSEIYKLKVIKKLVLFRAWGVAV